MARKLGQIIAREQTIWLPTRPLEPHIPTIEMPAKLVASPAGETRRIDSAKFIIGASQLGTSSGF